MSQTILLTSVRDYLPLFSIDPGTFLFTLINTGIIVLMYRFFLHLPVMGILAKRMDAVNSEMTEATKAKTEALKMEAQYKELISDAKAEADRIKANALSKVKAKEEEILREAETSATAMKQKAAEDVERERKRAVNEIKNQIAELVIMAAEAVAEKEISEADNASLIESFLVNASAE